jgi:hypothetical protein
MKAFDETYADADFERAIAEARRGWMADVPRETQPDLGVDGMRASILARVLGALVRSPA